MLRAMRTVPAAQLAPAGKWGRWKNFCLQVRCIHLVLQLACDDQRDGTEVQHIISWQAQTPGDDVVCREGTVVSIVTPGESFVVDKMARKLGVKIPEMEAGGGELRLSDRRS